MNDMGVESQLPVEAESLVDKALFSGMSTGDGPTPGPVSEGLPGADLRREAG